MKRFATGILKTVALMAPEAPPYMGMGQPNAGNQFLQLRDALQADFNVELTQLAEGRVPESADLLMVLDPESLDDVARAIQALMVPPVNAAHIKKLLLARGRATASSSTEPGKRRPDGRACRRGPGTDRTRGTRSSAFRPVSRCVKRGRSR